MSVVTHRTNKMAEQQGLSQRLAWFFMLWIGSVLALFLLTWPLRWLFGTVINL